MTVETGEENVFSELLVALSLAGFPEEGASLKSFFSSW